MYSAILSPAHGRSVHLTRTARHSGASPVTTDHQQGKPGADRSNRVKLAIQSVISLTPLSAATDCKACADGQDATLTMNAGVVQTRAGMT